MTTNDSSSISLDSLVRRLVGFRNDLQQLNGDTYCFRRTSGRPSDYAYQQVVKGSYGPTELVAVIFANVEHISRLRAAIYAHIDKLAEQCKSDFQKCKAHDSKLNQLASSYTKQVLKNHKSIFKKTDLFPVRPGLRVFACFGKGLVWKNR